MDGPGHWWAIHLDEHGNLLIEDSAAEAVSLQMAADQFWDMAVLLPELHIFLCSQCASTPHDADINPAYGLQGAGDDGMDIICSCKNACGVLPHYRKIVQLMPLCAFWMGLSASGRSQKAYILILQDVSSLQFQVGLWQEDEFHELC